MVTIIKKQRELRWVMPILKVCSFSLPWRKAKNLRVEELVSWDVSKMLPKLKNYLRKKSEFECLKSRIMSTRQRLRSLVVIWSRCRQDTKTRYIHRRKKLHSWRERMMHLKNSQRDNFVSVTRSIIESIKPVHGMYY